MGLQELKNAFPYPKEQPSVPPSDHGWFGPEHVELLSGALDSDVKVVLEIGSWMGKSTRFIASRASNATVIAVDHWNGSDEHRSNPGCNALLPTLYHTFIKSCWPFRNRIIPLRMNSVPGMRLLNQYGVMPDLIFIDASHDYDNAKADVSTALDLFPEAMLCGDDFLWEGVGKTVREHVEAKAMRVFVKGNVWWKEAPAFAHIKGSLPV